MSWEQHVLGGVTLEPYQITGRNFLLGPGVNGNRLLADVPRLGKTIQVLAALNIRLQLGGNVLILCPPGVRSNWRNMIRLLRDGDWRATVFGYNEITQYGLPKRNFGKYDVLIIDEAHALKNRDSGRTIAVYGPNADGVGGIVESAWETWCLTGTPQPNNPSELWTMLRTLAPSIIINDLTLRPFGLADFTNRYCYAYVANDRRKVTGVKNPLELRNRLKPFVLGRGYDVLGPGRQPPINEPFFIEPDPDSIREIEELEATPEGRAVRTAVERDDLDSLKKLELQAQRLREAWGLVKVNPIAELVEGECAEDPNLKFVLFAWHTKVINALKKRLSKLGAVVIAGGVSSAKQDEAKEKLWKDPKCRVLIGQHIAAGEGIDLSVADELIFVESSWVPKDQMQASMRVYNIKKARRSRVRTAMLADTLDTRIASTVAQKAKASAAVFGF